MAILSYVTGMIPDTSKRYLYRRAEGDLEVWAESKEKAALVMRRNGYEIDESKIIDMGNGVKVVG